MIEREKQFLALYQNYRYEDQKQFYDLRSAEFEKAHAQATTLTISLMVLAAIAAALTSLNLFGLKMLWAVLAVIFPVLSTTIAAYDNLYAFDRQTKLYRDASQALQSAR